MEYGKLTAFAALAFLLLACDSRVDKPAALDPQGWKRAALERRLPMSKAQTPRLTPGPSWLDRLSPGERILFAGYRTEQAALQFVLVLDIDPPADRLVLWPLPQNRDPLGLLTDATGRQRIFNALADWQKGEPPPGSFALPLAHTFAEKRLGLPVPAPGRAFAVAANYLSHLVNDLAIEDAGLQAPLLTRARPRVFVKYPPVPPPGQFRTHPGFEPLGPFDAIRHPGIIQIPSAMPGISVEAAPAFFDYEVEIAAVLGRSLTWEDVKNATDRELQKAIAGYLLASDFKARNPQVMQRILTRDRPIPAPNPYRIGDADLDAILGPWDRETCQWWSYAASWGENLTLGPFFLAAAEDGSLPPRAFLAARSYAAADVRGHPIPDGLDADIFYLRQLALATSEQEFGEQLIWEIPATLRSILDPRDNALDFIAKPLRLEKGDLILLGTPGGTVITSRPLWQLEILDYLLFWLDARQWHDLFFRQGADNYLYPGDQLFFWAEGLGYQELKIAPASAPPPE